jgi:isoquinoline 1-oxidoreductase subunit alpha
MRNKFTDMPTMTLFVNGAEHRIDADAEMPLLWALRDLLRLTGTKYGCGTGVCGACTIHENGEPVRSCQIQLSATQGKHYVTIEGLSTQGNHPCQLAWLEEDVAQCGYCQAGAIMETAALIKRKPNVSDADIDAALGDHVCRCGTYQRMRRAVYRAARQAART